jgi:hypothetical protein
VIFSVFRGVVTIRAAHAFRTCEFITLAKDGTSVTWPTLPFFQPTTGRFLITISNIRRNPRVSLPAELPEAPDEGQAYKRLG